jgi:hypothetical protein
MRRNHMFLGAALVLLLIFLFTRFGKEGFSDSAVKDLAFGKAITSTKYIDPQGGALGVKYF